MRSPEQRRPLLLALGAGLAIAVALWLTGLDHAASGLACLGPAIFALALLVLGRYPGERLLLALARTRVRRPRPRAAAPPRERHRARTPRGGLLLGAALAGRAPPTSRDVAQQAIARRRRAPAGCRSAAARARTQLPGGIEMRKLKHAVAVALATLGATAALAPAVAGAHISLHPNTVPAGAFATLDVRVPGEQEGAYINKVDVQFPAGFVGVDYENVPGWSVKLIESKLATPIEEDGEKIDTEVSQIVWSWTGPLGKVENGQFVDFPLSLAIPADATGKALEFRTVQTYSNGQVVHWIDPSLQAEHPAPRINVTAKGGVIEDVAGDEAGPTAGQTGATQSASSTAPTVVKSSGGASKGLAIVALVLGALGLIAGLAALARSRRSSTA